MKLVGLKPLLAAACWAALLGNDWSSATTFEWLQQFGSIDHLGNPANDFAYGLTVDGLGNPYVGGTTYGSFVGETYGVKGFVRKFDGAGQELWTLLLPNDQESLQHDFLSGMHADSMGHLYIAGSNDANWHALLSKYDDAGNLVWRRTFGVAEFDSAADATTDDIGNVFVTGGTSGSLDGDHGGMKDVFLRKYDLSGNLLWGRQLASKGNDNAWNIAVADGSVLIAGNTNGDLFGVGSGAADTFIAKFDAEGELQWSHQFATPVWCCLEMAADASGNAYLAGGTAGDLGGPNAGESDVYLRKYDPDGNILWTRQFGTSLRDNIDSLAIDSQGNILIAGSTRGELGGPNVGSADAYVAKLDPAGSLLWIQQFGSPELDWASGVAAAGPGDIYVAGYTEGELAAPNAGKSYDVFIGKLTDLPSGDYNNDGTVNAADYTVWRDGLGTSYNSGDYEVWTANFGSTSLGAASQAFVTAPEPAGLSLVLACIPLAIVRWRRQLGSCRRF